MRKFLAGTTPGRGPGRAGTTPKSSGTGRCEIFRRRDGTLENLPGRDGTTRKLPGHGTRRDPG